MVVGRLWASPRFRRPKAQKSIGDESGDFTGMDEKGITDTPVFVAIRR